MKVIDPIGVTDAMLVASSVDENDYPAWSGAATYAAGHRVIVTATHRVYESVSAGNIGNNPVTTSPAKWIDIGPTNRWAMFDAAVGSRTGGAGGIVVVLAPLSTTTLSILDTDAATVRVRVLVAGSPVYDQTQAVGDAGRDTALFLDLPGTDGAQVEVTAAANGGGGASIGSLIMGPLIDLGITEAGPSIGINDFSRRETDDFGVTTIVERAWAKRMSIRSKIETAVVDMTQRRLAALRARACLWIGEEGYDSLAIYGFFKEFSIDLTLETISYCTLTIEGLTTAGALDSSGSGLSVIFRNDEDMPDTPGTGTGVVPAGWSSAPFALTVGQYRWWSQAEFNADKQLTEWTTPVKVAGASWSEISDDDADHPKPDDGATKGAPEGTEVGGSLVQVIGDDVYIPSLIVDKIKAGTGNSAQFASTSASTAVPGTGMGNDHIVLTSTVTLLGPGSIQAVAALALSYTGTPTNSSLILAIDGTTVFAVGGGTTEISVVLAGAKYFAAAGSYTVEVIFQGPSNMTVQGRNSSTTIIY